MYIASISTDLKIHVWPNGQLLHTYKSNLQGFIKSISWSKDGSWLVLVPSKGPAEIISVRDNLKHLHSIQDIQQPTCATFQNTTKRNIALGTTTGTVLVYDIKTKKVHKHFPRSPSTIFKVDYSAKDAFLTAACENGEILLYNSVTYNLSATYKIANSKTVSALRCHMSKRNLLCCGSEEGIVEVWDIHANKLLVHNQLHAAAVTDISFSPIRADLFVSTGFDRKLSFYDMTQKSSCIQKILDRSPTAIDFCPDGVGIVVAMHDGVLNSYDTRNMTCPLYTFKAHNSEVKQLLFQKCATENTSSEYAFFTDSADSGDEIDVPTIINKSKQNKDSFDHIFCGDVLPEIPEIPSEACSDLDGGDSFMAAIGLNSNNVTVNSARDSISNLSKEGKALDSKQDIENNSFNSPMLVKTKLGNKSHFQDIQRKVSETLLPSAGLPPLKRHLDIIKAQDASTPKFPLNDNGSKFSISPIVSASNSNSIANMKITDMKELIREVVKDEIKLEMETFQQQLKYEFMDILAQIRRQFLDLQMSIVKEFVQMESNITRIKENMDGVDGYGEECLIQENIKLRKELAALRDQVVSNTDD